MKSLIGASLVAACVIAAIAFAPPQDTIESVGGGPRSPLAMPDGVKVIVFLFTSTDCPISNRYAPEVQRLAMAFKPRGVLFRLIYPSPADSRDAIRDHLTAFGYAGPIQAYRDPKQALVKFVHATITPEVAVYDGKRVVYRGRIDDRYVEIGVERPAPTRHDLADALNAVLAGRPVAQATTQAVGCFIADVAR